MRELERETLIPTRTADVGSLPLFPAVCAQYEDN